MALKKKITKAEFDKLSDAIKGEYKADGDEYKLDLDGDEDVTALKNAKEHEKAARKKAEKELKEAQERLEAIEEEKNKGAGNVEALEKSWKTKLETKEAEAKAKVDKLTAALTNKIIGGEAQKLALELSPKAHKLLIPFIEKRLQADLEGDEPKMRILDKDGKPSALTLEDLKKEFVDNADFSAIIVGSKATGGAGADKRMNNGGAGSDNNKPLDLSKASPKAIVDVIKARKESQT